MMQKLLIFIGLMSSLYADIDIQDAWNKVLNENDGLKASAQDVERSALLKEAAKAMYLPEISLDGTYTKLNKELTIELSVPGLGALPPYLLSDRDVFTSKLSLLWPLYTGGKIDATQDIYAQKENEDKAKLKLEKDKAFLKLVKVYYGVVMTKAVFDTRVEAQNALQIHFEHATKLKENGQIATIELLNAQVKLDSAKIDTRKALHNHEILQLALFDLINTDEIPSSNFFMDNNLQGPMYYKTNMLHNYAGLDVIKAKQKQNDSMIDIQKAAYLPTFYAFGNYSLYQDESASLDDTLDWIAGVGVKYTFVSRDGRSEKIAAAKILKNRLTHTLKQAQKDLALLVEKTYKEMLQYKEEYKDLSSSLKMAQENLRLRNLAFKEGLATSVDVVDAQMFLTGAKTKRLNAIYNYEQKIAQLSVLSGNSNLFFELEKNSKGMDINE